MVLGTAEGGMKITLYNVNDINPDKIDINLLNEYYFQTMHHEFAHILHQTKNYDPAFDRITENAISAATGIWWELTAMHGNKDLSLPTQ